MLTISLSSLQIAGSLIRFLQRLEVGCLHLFYPSCGTSDSIRQFWPFLSGRPGGSSVFGTTRPSCSCHDCILRSRGSGCCCHDSIRKSLSRRSLGFPRSSQVVTSDRRRPESSSLDWYIWWFRSLVQQDDFSSLHVLFKYVVISILWHLRECTVNLA